MNLTAFPRLYMCMLKEGGAHGKTMWLTRLYSNSGTYMYVPSIDDNAFNFLTFKNYPNHEVS